MEQVLIEDQLREFRVRDNHMYIQNLLRESDIEALYDFIDSNSFGTIVVQTSKGLDANHLPFELHRDSEGKGVLQGHVSRGNPFWRDVSIDSNVLVVFTGASCYMSPTHNPGRWEHGKVAPSWNYSAVHISGVAKAIEDESWLLDHLQRLTQKNEAGRADPWTMKDASQEFIFNAVKHIVGIEIDITEIFGKFQASQQYKESVRLEIMKGLIQEGTPASVAVAQMMSTRRSMRQ